MKHEIVMPKAGLTNTEGVISSWTLQEGARVKKGDVIGDIENEKSTIPLTSPADGYLAGLAEPGEEFKVGAVIGYVVDSADETVETAAAPQAAPVSAPAQAPVQQAKAAAPGVRKRISPYAKKLAESRGVDYSQLPGTGPGGSVVAADILKALEAAAAAPVAAAASAAPAVQAEYTETPATAMRRSIAKNLHASLQNTAQAQVSSELDVTALMRFKDSMKDMEEALGNKITLNEILSYIVVKLAAKHPCLNAVLTDAGMIRQYRHVALSFALANEKGLITPVVREADKLSLNQFSLEMKRLVALGRDNALDLSDLQGGTITISNMGMYPVDAFTPIVNPPQAAIFGFGRTVTKAVYVGDSFEKREMMHVSLVFDHRSMDGANAGEVFKSLKAFLDQPQLLLLY
ncbi:MAG: dihydrolipoamide acetyltransferase family protein [Christensenellales bacterium]|jgi:pyruvate dehydrogenase E2 component (dihydrolipoamide acetyltransferase)